MKQNVHTSKMVFKISHNSQLNNNNLIGVLSILKKIMLL